MIIINNLYKEAQVMVDADLIAWMRQSKGSMGEGVSTSTSEGSQSKDED